VTLDATIDLRLGSLHLDVELVTNPREVVAILGPNGAGKTTLLRCLAGLLAIDDGQVTLDGTVVDDPAANVFVPAEHRSVGVVFQDYLLFANLSAVDNVAFGLHARGASKAHARRVAHDWLEQVGLADHAHHRPRALSGGQQQRVALARALATNPRLLLLDEPLAALDAGARSDVRRDLRRHLATYDGVRLLVTHDPIDAYALADRIVVVEDGHITQTGTLADVTAHPRSRYVAELVGTTMLTGRTTGTLFTLPSGATITIANTGESVDGDSYAAIHPHAVALYRNPPEGSPRNVWEGTVADIDTHLDRVRIRIEGAVPVTAEITPGALAALDLKPGDTVWASVKATDISTYSA
jgi:molybdate transport system ATP-binding protein